MSNPEPLGKKLKIKRHFPEDLKTYFVSNIAIQHDPTAFFISFFEILPPLVVGDTEEETKRMLTSLDHVDATCVSRIILTPDKMREFLAAMRENYQKYEDLLKKLSEARKHAS